MGIQGSWRNLRGRHIGFRNLGSWSVQDSGSLFGVPGDRDQNASGHPQTGASGGLQVEGARVL